MSEDSKAAFEKWWNQEEPPSWDHPDYKEWYLKCWQACEKRLLLSKVQLPERRTDHFKIILKDTAICGQKIGYNKGFNECLDQIKLVLLTVEQMQALLPSDESIRNYLQQNKCNSFDDIYRATSHFIRDFISKRLAGM